MEYHALLLARFDSKQCYITYGKKLPIVLFRFDRSKSIECACCAFGLTRFLLSSSNDDDWLLFVHIVFISFIQRRDKTLNSSLVTFDKSCFTPKYKSHVINFYSILFNGKSLPPPQYILVFSGLHPESLKFCAL